MAGAGSKKIILNWQLCKKETFFNITNYWILRRRIIISDFCSNIFFSVPKISFRFWFDFCPNWMICFVYNVSVYWNVFDRCFSRFVVWTHFWVSDSFLRSSVSANMRGFLVTIFMLFSLLFFILWKKRGPHALEGFVVATANFQFTLPNIYKRTHIGRKLYENLFSVYIL